MTKTTRSVKIWGQRQECFTFTDLHPLAWEEIYWLQEQPLYIVLSSHHDLQLVSSPKEEKSSYHVIHSSQQKALMLSSEPLYEILALNYNSISVLFSFSFLLKERKH